MGFVPPALAGTAQAAINDVAILALQPSSDPQPFSAPAGGGNEQGVEVSAICFRKAFEEVLSR